MWYVSCEGWRHADLPTYNIKIATSIDGIVWNQDGHVCLDFQKNEVALARPCVLFEDNIFKMWISYKTIDQTYRIGYAESIDGFYKIPSDNRDLNYQSYFSAGIENIDHILEYNSNNTKMLDVKETKELLLKLEYEKKELMSYKNEKN